MIPGPEQDDLAQLTDRLPPRQQKWQCPYCLNEVEDEWSLCCHELHAVPMVEDFE